MAPEGLWLSSSAGGGAGGSGGSNSGMGALE